MAIQLNNGVSNEYARRLNDATPISSAATDAWSIACWFYRDTDTAAHETMAVMAVDDVGVATTASGLRVSSGDVLQVLTSGGVSTVRNAQPTGVWTYAAATFGNATGTSYYGTAPGTLTAGSGRSNVAGVFSTVVVGRHPSTANPFSGRIAHLRLWTGALSEAEFELEMTLDSHFRTSGLWAAYEFTNDTSLATLVADTSGNGRNLTGFNIDAGNYIAGPLAAPPSQSNAPRASLLRMLRSA
jgi:hypothetical protein